MRLPRPRIHKHTMDDALAEGDVAKIIYSNRHCPLNGDDKSLERYYDILDFYYKWQEDLFDLGTHHRRELEYSACCCTWLLSERYDSKFFFPICKLSIIFILNYPKAQPFVEIVST